MITQMDKCTALVLIDLQKGMLKRTEPGFLDDVLKNASRLADEFRRRNLPVVIVSVDPFHPSWQKTRKEGHNMQSSNAIAHKASEVTDNLAGLMDSAIDVAPGDIRIVKHTWNAFFDTPLHDELKKCGVTQIVLGGVSTGSGVEGTARAAAELGYNIAFAVDAMADDVPEVHDNSIKHIFPRLGESGTTEEIIGMLTTI
ncbi:MAG: isochorismatase family protein [Candidatus Azobacteroides sp.]|nr:isochorismatase family protein [Candidatus Azobacteroides sp.]